MNYIFRDNTILEFDTQTKQVRTTKYFNDCKFIPEDYINLAIFFDDITAFLTGMKKEEDLKDIKVD